MRGARTRRLVHRRHPITKHKSNRRLRGAIVRISLVIDAGPREVAIRLAHDTRAIPSPVRERRRDERGAFEPLSRVGVGHGDRRSSMTMMRFHDERGQ
jgi:hypothetical protein